MKKYTDAIGCYSEAILMHPDNAIFYLNRAKCHKEIKEFEACLADGKKSVELDPAYIKGHTILGEALVELGKLEVGSYAKIDLGVKEL